MQTLLHKAPHEFESYVTLVNTKIKNTPLVTGELSTIYHPMTSSHLGELASILIPEII